LTGAAANHVVTVWAIRASRGTSTWIIQGMPSCLTWADRCPAPRNAFLHPRKSCERFSLSGGVLRPGSPKQDSNILRVVLSCAATCRCDPEKIFVLLFGCGFAASKPKARTGLILTGSAGFLRVQWCQRHQRMPRRDVLDRYAAQWAAPHTDSHHRADVQVRRAYRCRR
jgi:hypothetical protein